MLESINLDDQSFDEIVGAAVSRIPYIYPEWTDHNPHDPGITILELCAWYKEMQQYHMNVVTDRLQKKLLALLGVRPAPAMPAVCRIQISGGAHILPRLSRLETPEGVPFELAERAQTYDFSIENVFAQTPGGYRDISEIILKRGVKLPVELSSGVSALHMGFLGEPPRRLRLYMHTAAGGRNPFEPGQEPPRAIEYSFSGAGSAVPLLDGTHALSESGFLEFDCPPGWSACAPAPGLPVMRYLTLFVTDPGCEEDARIEFIATDAFTAYQMQTWARHELFTLEPAPDAPLPLNDALSLGGDVLLFIKTANGFSQRETRSEGGRLFADASGALPQRDNAIAISLDPVMAPALFFDSTGLPGQRLEIPAGERTVLVRELRLLCDTLHRDGSISPELWKYVDDLDSCGPRDRVFTCDETGSVIVFGDGEHGAVLPREENAVVAASLAVTSVEQGNIPAGNSLKFIENDGLTVSNSAARGGRSPETVAHAAAELARRLNSPCKCVSASDYESIAKKTPGLRIKTVRALVMYDPDSPVEHVAEPIVTLVVVPNSPAPLPMPNKWFIGAVERHMERHRSVNTRIKVIAPAYSGMIVRAEVVSREADIEQQIRSEIDSYFALGAGSIGKRISHSDLELAIGGLPGVLRLGSLTISPAGAGCLTEPSGDIIIKRHAAPYLARLEVTRL